MGWTKAREVTAAIATIVFLIAILVVASAKLGWNIPVISNIVNALGY